MLVRENKMSITLFMQNKYKLWYQEAGLWWKGEEATKEHDRVEVPGMFAVLTTAMTSHVHTHNAYQIELWHVHSSS